MVGGIDDLLLIREIEEFLFHEVDLLDRRRFDDWMDLFTEDGIYWVPMQEGQENPHDSHSIFHDDKPLMAVRMSRLRDPANYAQTPPSRTRHLVANVVLEENQSGDGEIHVRSSLIMFEYRMETQRVFGGEARHRLRREADRLRIAWKRVDLVNSEAIHAHMSVPF